MRQFKFRAWDKPNKRMLYYDGFHWHDEYNLCYLGGTLDVPAEDNLEWMQALALPDKNGQLIYEGDVMKVRARTEGRGKNTRFKEFNMVVEWNEHAAGFHLLYPEDYGQYRFIDGNWSSHEIIGNIYQNPELIQP